MQQNMETQVTSRNTTSYMLHVNSICAQSAIEDGRHVHTLIYYEEKICEIGRCRVWATVHCMCRTSVLIHHCFSRP